MKDETKPDQCLVSIDSGRAEGPAASLLQQWTVAIQERDKLLLARKDNMFMESMGIEVHLGILQSDSHMNAFFLDKLMKVVARLEADMLNRK